ncbi:MAG: bifunctional DNA primase/polymerase [Terracidiphilus sp.]
MKTLEEFFSEHNRGISPFPRFGFPQRSLFSVLSQEVHDTANRGFAIFPVPELAKLTAQRDLLIGEATSDLSRLEELAAMYPPSTWRAAVGSSGYCVVRMNAQEGRAWFSAKCREQGVDCLTLTAVSGDMAWAIFRWPKNLVLQASAEGLPSGVSVLDDGDSFPVPPSRGCKWANACAEIEAVPYWLRELAFESPDNPPGKIVPVPSPFPHPAACGSTARFDKPHRGTKKGFPTCDQAGWRAGFRISRRR